MNKKYLICSSILCGLALTIMLLMFMPVLNISGMTMFNLVGNADIWYNFEDYVWGIGAIILLVVLPILIINSVLCILSACNVIKNKRMDKVLYIINIVLAMIALTTIIFFFLGYGRSISAKKVKLFVGTTYFKYTTSYLPLHCVATIFTAFTALINKSTPFVQLNDTKE